MQKIFKKFVFAISYLGLFCPLFIILFINLLLGFSYCGFDTAMEAIRILAVSSAIAVGLPLVICYQHHKITKLENAIDAVYSNVPKNLF